MQERIRALLQRLGRTGHCQLSAQPPQPPVHYNVEHRQRDTRTMERRGPRDSPTAARRMPQARPYAPRDPGHGQARRRAEVGFRAGDGRAGLQLPRAQVRRQHQAAAAGLPVGQRDGLDRQLARRLQVSRKGRLRPDLRRRAVLELRHGILLVEQLARR